MITAFSGQLLTIDELRARLPDLRARETGLKDQIAALAADRDAYLRLAGDLQGFLARLRGSTATATVEDRQRVLRAVVQDILIGPEKITIREHAASGGGSHDTTDTEGDMRESSLGLDDGPVPWGRPRVQCSRAACRARTVHRRAGRNRLVVGPRAAARRRR
jgi:site-specific DNA recombinase